MIYSISGRLSLKGKYDLGIFKKNQLRNLLKPTVGNWGWGILPYPEINKTLEKTI